MDKQRRDGEAPELRTARAAGHHVSGDSTTRVGGSAYTI